MAATKNRHQPEEPRAFDLAVLRSKLRQLPRGDILLMLERAIELLPNEGVSAVVGDFLRPAHVTPSAAVRSLLDEVREFSHDAMAGKYYQSFQVNSQNCTLNSPGTDHFIADFDRLEKRVVAAVGHQRDQEVREMFELLFAPLHRIQEAMDDVLFWADEGGVWEMCIAWDRVFAGYFTVLARTAEPAEFKQKVERVIEDFAEHDSLEFMALAERIATDAR